MLKEHSVFLSLGSNLGDSVSIIQNAYTSIDCEAGRIVKKSSLYQTKAWGMEAGTPDFVNSVIEIQTRLSASELLNQTQLIEKAFGRTEKSTNGYYTNRYLDIDIIYFEDQVTQATDLIIPHPLLQERLYVLEPMNEIAPDYRHPILGKTTEELLNLLLENQASSQAELQLEQVQASFS